MDVATVAARSEPSAEVAGSEDYLVVEAENEFDEAGISDCSHCDDRLGEPVEIACAAITVRGDFATITTTVAATVIPVTRCRQNRSAILCANRRALRRVKRCFGIVQPKERLAVVQVSLEVIKKLTAF